MTEREKPSSTRDEHFERIDATPEQLAKAILRTPPKKPEDWEYMKVESADSSA